MRQKCKAILRIIFSFCWTGLVVLGVWVYHLAPLRSVNGAHTYYIYTASSQAVGVYALNVNQAPFLDGESVYVVTSSALNAEREKDKILRAFSAQVLWVEQVGGVTSYYAFSPRLTKSVRLFGKTVNLHVAVSKDGYAVGSPIIFGGY